MSDSVRGKCKARFQEFHGDETAKVINKLSNQRVQTVRSFPCYDIHLGDCKRFVHVQFSWQLNFNGTHKLYSISIFGVFRFSGHTLIHLSMWEKQKGNCCIKKITVLLSGSY